MSGGVCAVVVTHDRRDLLRASLVALARQTRPCDGILVVDTASRDASSQMVITEFPEVDLLRTDADGGSAGGFHEGVKVAHGRGYDWLWLLHDDVAPSTRALEELLRATGPADGEPRPVLVASKALRPDGCLDEPSLPRPDYKRIEHAVLAYERGLQPLRSASFVSLLVSRDAIERHGLPAKAFSAGGEGLEFTARLLRTGDGYLAPRSVVEHSGQAPGTVLAPDAPALAGHVSDRILMLKSSSWGKREKIDLAVGLLRSIGRTVRSPRSLALMLRAVVEGALRPIG